MKQNRMNVFHPVFCDGGARVHPVVKVLWMVSVGIIFGSIFGATVFGFYSDVYVSIVLVVAALPIMAAIILDAYVRQLSNLKWKIIVCTVMFLLLMGKVYLLKIDGH